MKANLLRRLLAAKATVFVGLAMMLSLLLGTVSVAQADPGDPFFIGRVNRALDSISQLVGFPAGPMLRIDNNSTATGATALDLQVEPGKTPMTVNSSVRVANLNADRLDSQDSSAFLTSKLYLVVNPPNTGTHLTFDNTRRQDAQCDPGDRVVSGGISSVDRGTIVLESFPADESVTAWAARIQNDGTLDSFSAVAICADQAFPFRS